MGLGKTIQAVCSRLSLQLSSRKADLPPFRSTFYFPARSHGHEPVGRTQEEVQPHHRVSKEKDSSLPPQERLER